ncbi:hypothetical protein [Fusibacter sp. 3D3]|uniref:hypothetical protein n=1 Tax=Fusibacter sp. 3D3 TaxID=1048380 RepID=UPI000853260B|nr:hypothetical protein [Fusibacter sp. 3D3]GAU75680.1 hypothetical protein F3D3_0271 [Fusibacter sp. 3D3]
MKAQSKIILSILLCLSLILFSGCARKSEEVIRAEIKAELEAEAEANQSNTNTEINTDAQVITGLITINPSPFEEGILLDEPIVFNGKSYSEIGFQDAYFSKYLDRTLFEYSPDGPILSGQYYNNIPISVSITKDSLRLDDRNLLSAQIDKIISINNHSDLIDRTQEDYSLEFYETVFNTMIEFSMDIATYPEDIHEFILYQTDSMFKTAVDKLIDSGKFIITDGDHYVLSDVSNPSEDQGQSIEYNLQDLKNGTAIAGLVVKGNQFKAGDSTVDYTLEGSTSISGELFYDAEFWEAYIFVFQDTELLNYKIKIEFPDQYIFDQTFSSCVIRNQEELEANLTAEEIELIKSGQSLKVTMLLKDISTSYMYQSEGGIGADFISLSRIQ